MKQEGITQALLPPSWTWFWIASTATPRVCCSHSKKQALLPVGKDNNLFLKSSWCTPPQHYPCWQNIHTILLLEQGQANIGVQKMSWLCIFTLWPIFFVWMISLWIRMANELIVVQWWWLWQDEHVVQVMSNSPMCRRKIEKKPNIPQKKWRNIDDSYWNKSSGRMLKIIIFYYYYVHTCLFIKGMDCCYCSSIFCISRTCIRETMLFEILFRF
jgi:hypothetical protein